MWNYMKKEGYDVVLTSVLLFCTTILAASAAGEKTLKQTAIIISLVAVDVLYITKAWEAKTTREELEEYKEELDTYKASVYTTEILTSDVPKYMGSPEADLCHLSQQHVENKGTGKYKHQVETYRVSDEVVHYYLTPLGSNELV